MAQLFRCRGGPVGAALPRRWSRLLVPVVLLVSSGAAAVEFRMRDLVPTPVEEHTSPVGVVSGHFDADRRPDMVMCFGGSAIKIFSQDAHGQQVLRREETLWDQSVLPEWRTYPLGVGYCRMHVLDLDGNGVDDLVVSHGLGVLVLKFFPDGRVERQEYGRRGIEFDHGDGFQDSVVGDFNGDGRVDLVGIRLDATVSLLANLGDGNFAPAVDAGRLEIPHPFRLRLAAGDLDGDGFPDLAVAVPWMGSSADSLTAVMYNDGKGHLFERIERTARIVHHEPALVHVPAIGDVTGDGKDDLVIVIAANQPWASIDIHEQDGNGKLKPLVAYPSFDIPDSIWIGDADGDGRNDIVLLHASWYAMMVYLQQQDGSLDFHDIVYQVYNLQSGVDSLSVRDFDGDGCKDILLATQHYSWMYGSGCLPSSNADVAASLQVSESSATLHIDNLDAVLPAHAVVATVRLDSSDASTRFPAAPAGCTVSPANVMARVYVCRIGRMEAGETRSFHLPLVQKGRRPLGYRVSARASVSSHGEDPVPGNNVAARDSWSVTRRPAARLQPPEAARQPCRLGRCAAPR